MSRRRLAALVAVVLGAGALVFAAGMSFARRADAPAAAPARSQAEQRRAVEAETGRANARPARAPRQRRAARAGRKHRHQRVRAPLSNTVLPGPEDGSLHVAGRSVLDSRGRPFLLHAIQIRGMGAGSGSATPDACGAAWAPPDPTQANAVATIGFNGVYYSVSWQNLEPTPPTRTADGTLTHHWNTAWLQVLHRSIADFTKRHVRVVLAINHYQWSAAFTSFRTGQGRTLCEGSGMPAWLYPGTAPGTTPSAARCAFLADAGTAGVTELPQEGLSAALAELARTFHDDRYVVALDALSEPGFGGDRGACNAPSDGFVRFIERAATAIHQVAPRLLVIAEDGTYSHLAHVGTIIPRAPRATGVVYAFEEYPKQRDQLRVPRDALARAKRLGLPALIYAFDAYRGGYPVSRRSDPRWQSDTSALLTFARANGIGWNFWALMHGAGSFLVGGGKKTARADLISVFRPDLVHH